MGPHKTHDVGGTKLFATRSLHSPVVRQLADHMRLILAETGVGNYDFSWGKRSSPDRFRVGRLVAVLSFQRASDSSWR